MCYMLEDMASCRISPKGRLGLCLSRIDLFDLAGSPPPTWGGVRHAIPATTQWPDLRCANQLDGCC